MSAPRDPLTLAEQFEVAAGLIDRYNATPWWKLRTRVKLRMQALRLLMKIAP